MSESLEKQSLERQVNLVSDDSRIVKAMFEI